MCDHHNQIINGVHLLEDLIHINILFNSEIFLKLHYYWTHILHTYIFTRVLWGRIWCVCLCTKEDTTQAQGEDNLRKICWDGRWLRVLKPSTFSATCDSTKMATTL